MHLGSKVPKPASFPVCLSKENFRALAQCEIFEKWRLCAENRHPESGMPDPKNFDQPNKLIFNSLFNQQSKPEQISE